MPAVHGGEDPTLRWVPVSGGGSRRRRADVALAAVALILNAVGSWWLFTRGVAPADTESEVVETVHGARHRAAHRCGNGYSSLV